MLTLIVTEKGGTPKRMDFDKDEVTVGRVPGNDIVLPKGNVSKRHSRVVKQDGRFFVVDLKSTNGTYLNGRRITTPSVIRPGDKIYIGDFVVMVEMEGAPAGDDMGDAPEEGMDLGPQGDAQDNDFNNQDDAQQAFGPAGGGQRPGARAGGPPPGGPGGPPRGAGMPGRLGGPPVGSPPVGGPPVGGPWLIGHQIQNHMSRS
jgi:pilus assembly protein CpaF